MKKLLYIIGFMMMASAVIQPLAALGQGQFSGNEEDLPYSTARIFSKAVEVAGMDPNADWTQTFGAAEEKDIGKNLYLVIYNKTRNAPVREADKNIANKYGIPQTDLVLFLNGDYTKMIEARPTMTQDEALNKIAEIQQNFKEEKELLTLEAEINAATQPSEIFANGDLSDSGFDLINDLTIIENLLFLKTNPIDVGGSYVPSATIGPIPPGTVTSQPAAAATVSASNTNPPAVTQPVQTTAPANQIPGVGILTGQAPGDTVTAPIQYSSAAGTTGAPGKFNPNTCFGTDKFAAALTDFAANARTNGNYKDLGSAAASAAAAAQTPTAGTNATPGTAASSAAAGAGAGSATPATGTATEPFTAAPEAPAAPIQPAPADKWLKDKLCVGSFCLYINLVMKPAASSYQNADNCIACHAEKINDVLKKVISYTLVPSKAPGNLGEAGKCKKALSTAFSSVSMNIYTLAMPVQTPMNDDLVYGKTIEEDWFNYCSQVAAPFTCRNEAPPKDVSQATYEPPKTILDMVSKSALATASDDATQSDVSKNIDTATTGYALEKIAGLNSYDMTKAADKGIQTYQPLKTEMDRMIYYFTSIQKLLHSLHEPVDGIAGPQACTDLKNKKDCE